MILLIVGSTSLVGSHLVEYIKTKDPSIQLLTPSSDEFNLLDLAGQDSYLTQEFPDLVINFAAYTDVSKAEQENNDRNGNVWKINVTGTTNLAKLCRKFNLPLIHISTDMVFSGKKSDPGPYDEKHASEGLQNNLCWYGWTKKKAEDAVSTSLSKFTIIRISNPVRHAFDSKLDYIRKILNKADLGQEISLFTDQYLTLTLIDNVSQVIFRLINKPYFGFMHVSSSNLFTPYNLGTYLLTHIKKNNYKLNKSRLDDFITRTGNSTRYPQFGGLKVSASSKILGMRFPTWQEIIDEIVVNQ